MNKLRLFFIIAISASPIIAFNSSAQSETSASDANIRIVPCGTKVPSLKRGVCANKLSEADFRAFAPGVSWYYNWHYKSDMHPPSDAKMEFIPQVWGDSKGDVAGLDSYLGSVSVKPPVVLGVNEPNLRGQAFISPEETAKLVLKIKAVADKYHIPVVAPNMALGSSGNDSIKAMDPIENKMVTYTFFVPFLKAFFHFLGGNDQVAGIGLHSYGNIGELKWATGEMYKQFGKPVWMTEYANWNAKNGDAVNYLIDATEFLENNPHVGGYAWFKERANNASISLLEKEPGKLSELGKYYVGLPAHDTKLYYRLPGKLDAADYATISNAKLTITNDKDAVGLFQVNPEGDAAEATYNLQVDNEGDYTISVHTFAGMTAKDPVEIYKGDKLLGSAVTTQHAWETVDTKIHLEKGLNTLRVKLNDHLLGWFNFASL